MSELPNKTLDSEPNPISKVPDPEVSSYRRRRRFTASYKLKVLEELDACATALERGALLRRKGIYSSSVSDWRKARQEGTLQALSKKRGAKVIRSPEQSQIASLQAKVQALESDLAQARTILDIQKKVCTLFGVSSPEQDEKNS